ncbi:MAG: hypothetical protein AB8G99_03720 [Planctomycetaceae bacterium]
MIHAKCECGRVVKTKDQNAGRTVNCPDCGDPLTLPKPRRKRSSPQEPGAGQLPPRRRAQSAKSPAAVEKAKDRKKQKKSQPAELDEKTKKQLDGVTKAILAVSGVVAACILGGIGYWIFSASSGGGSGGPTTLPKEYVAFTSENVDFTCVYPKGWERTSGGGSGGKPQWARFKMNDIRIEIKQAISGSLVGDIAQTMNQGEDADPLAPVRTAHDFRCNQLKAGTDGYEEGPPEVVDTDGFGPALLSTFDMQVWFSKDSGYRASVLAPSCQYNVTLYCPEDQRSRFKAVVKKIIESMG